MALLFADRHYRDLFDPIDQGFCTIEFLLDEHGAPVHYRVLEVNAAFAQHTGLENAVGRRLRELIPAHDDHWFRIYGVVALTGEPLRFQQQATAMGRADVARDEFLAMVGHELEASARPHAHGAAVDASPRDRRPRTEVLERQVDYLARLVGDLLDTARITRGKVELRRTRLELCEVVVRGVEIVSSLFEQRHHALEVLVAEVCS